MASFKHNDDANDDDDDDDGNDSTKTFFNHLESQIFFKYLCEEDFDLITQPLKDDLRFLTKLQTGLKNRKNLPKMTRKNKKRNKKNKLLKKIKLRFKEKHTQKHKKSNNKKPKNKK